MSSTPSTQGTSEQITVMLNDANNALDLLKQAECSKTHHERLRHRVLAARVYDSICEALVSLTLPPEDRLLMNQKLTLIKTRLYYAVA